MAPSRTKEGQRSVANIQVAHTKNKSRYDQYKIELGAKNVL